MRKKVPFHYKISLIFWPVCCMSLWTLGDRAKEVPWTEVCVPGAKQMERLLNIQSPDPGAPGCSDLSSEQSTTDPFNEDIRCKQSLWVRYVLMSMFYHLDLGWGQDCFPWCLAAHSPWEECSAALWPWQTWPCGDCPWSTGPGGWGRSGRSSGPGQRWWPGRSTLWGSPW